MLMNVKKGVSNVITMVLVIAFTLAITAVIIRWSGSLTEQELVKIRAHGDLVCVEEVEISVRDGCYDGRKVSVSIENLRDRDVGLIINVLGDKKVKPYEVKEMLRGFSSVDVNVPYSGEVRSVRVLPYIRVKGADVACSNKVVDYDVYEC